MCDRPTDKECDVYTAVVLDGEFPSAVARRLGITESAVSKLLDSHARRQGLPARRPLYRNKVPARFAHLSTLGPRDATSIN